MHELEIKYRTDGHDIAPRLIKMQIPGWAGDKQHGDGAVPQPWHCLPWIEGNTYGFELIHPWEDFTVTVRNGELVVDGGEKSAPKMFAPGHYGYGSGYDIQVPPGYTLRLEPHPRFFTDRTGTVPLVVPGHLQTEWWTRNFFVVFKAPDEGKTHIFRTGDPYAQVLVIPHRAKYNLVPMTPEEVEKRIRWEKTSYYYDAQIGKKSWTDNKGGRFNDKYKVLAHAWQRGGEIEIEKVFHLAATRAEAEKASSQPRANKVTGRFVKIKKSTQLRVDLSQDQQ